MKEINFKNCITLSFTMSSDEANIFFCFNGAYMRNMPMNLRTDKISFSKNYF